MKPQRVEMTIYNRLDEVKDLLVKLGKIALEEKQHQELDIDIATRGASIMEYISDEVTANGSAYSNDSITRFKYILEAMQVARNYVESLDN